MAHAKDPAKFRAATAHKAERAFVVYAMLGPDRSLRRAADHLTEQGFPVHAGTLKEWSVRYGWNNRAAGWDDNTTSPAPAEKDRQLFDVAAMNASQVRLGRRLSELASSGVTELVSQSVVPTANEVARLAEVGSRIERLAIGEVTERAEIVARVVRPVVDQMVAVFVECNELKDPRERLSAFAEGSQRVVDGMVSADLLEDGVSGSVES